MKSASLKFDPSKLRYNGLVGTGGIGSGKFFVLNGNHTLGREESRSGHFLKINDYCKQHIVLYYIQKLLGPHFSVIPVGQLGDDETGQLLLKEMKRDGFNLKWVQTIPQTSTLFSFCFFYPDGTGGNLTTDDSASSRVNAAYIEKVEGHIRDLGSEGMVMAAPEVPLDARKRLLQLGKQYGLFCSASFTTEEIRQALDKGILDFVDLLAINADEAASAAGLDIAVNDSERIAEQAVRKLAEINGNLQVSITAGKKGSWCWDGHRLNSFPAAAVKEISTAGAGDAFFSGLLTGIALGLHLFDSQQLATLIAGLSVTSPHTINKNIDRHSLKIFLNSHKITVNDNIKKLLED